MEVGQKKGKLPPGARLVPQTAGGNRNQEGNTPFAHRKELFCVPQGAHAEMEKG